MKHTYNKGRFAFLEYYSRILPQFSSPVHLESYLTAKNPPVLLFSPFHEAELKRLWKAQGLSWSPLPWFPQSLTWPPQVVIGTPLPGYSQGWIYSLNPASLLAVLALAPQTGESILDASAAPGGKTLGIAGRINLPLSVLVANDVSGPRFKRLRSVLKLFGYSDIPTWRLPIQTIAPNTDLRFDKILLDAPCSSEKHVFNSKRHIKIWSPKRISVLSKLQLHLLNSLLPLLKPDGTLVYSTCALAPQENEAVIASLLKNHPHLYLSKLPRLPVSGSGLPGFGIPDNMLARILRINDPLMSLDPIFIAVFQSRSTGSEFSTNRPFFSS